ncbi:Two-component sensor histidine kinase PleC [Liberibacter crescens BT-1]|uniref:histidine kinase n=1 Tax=Liberibacter crescens (strain BT-1) TaxID=1215343 RepID=L0EUL0_LIBCB|nr:PAS domain-containing sensor histidine kinase [Liberibacter crescens]AGA64515.1 Two-component sensor histidine kinase PleC [Liberibacter crescens BT-1]
MTNAQDAASSYSWLQSKLHQQGLISYGHILSKLRVIPISICSFAQLLLKRLIPMLSVSFLILIAIANVIRITSHHIQREKSIHQELILSATAASAAFSNTNINFDINSRTQAEAILESIIPQSQLPPESFILLIQADGLIFGSSVSGISHVGKKIGQIMPELLFFKKFGTRAGILESVLDKEMYYVSLVRATQNGGFVLAANPQAPIIRLWREEATSCVTLFALTSSILFYILYNYYIQLYRARTTNDNFLESNIRVETALSRGGCGIWDFDFVNRQFYWSQSMYEILGIPYSNKALSFGEIARLFYPKDRTIYDIARSIARGTSVQVDKIFRIRHSQGHYVWMRIRAQVMRTLSGHMHIIGIAMDVTEQQRLEQYYVEAGQRLTEAIECTSEAFVLWDKNDKLVMCNVHYQQAYGLPDDILVPGTKRSAVKSKSIRPVIERRIPSVSSRPGQAITTEVQLADLRWLQINEWVTRDGGLVSVGTDITQLKRNQARLKESERRLMATINDLSASRQILERQKSELSIANANYQAEKERAEAANKAKSEFLANMSHELRTPLNAILGFSEILKDQMFGPLGSTKYNEYAKDIHDSGKHLLNVINDILDMSKIEAEHIRIERKTIALHSLIEESLRFIAIPAQKKNILVEEKIAHELIFNADRRAMKQILINLLSNAVKFTNNGGRIVVRARKIRNKVIITIADTGIGIPKLALNKIGQPFEQVQSQYAKSKGGSGLGLAISRSLISLHNGTMKIRSREDIGTAISVRIPDNPCMVIKETTLFSNSFAA